MIDDAKKYLTDSVVRSIRGPRSEQMTQHVANEIVNGILERVRMKEIVSTLEELVSSIDQTFNTNDKKDNMPINLAHSKYRAEYMLYYIKQII